MGNLSSKSELKATKVVDKTSEVYKKYCTFDHTNCGHNNKESVGIWKLTCSAYPCRPIPLLFYGEENAKKKFQQECRKYDFRSDLLQTLMTKYHLDDLNINPSKNNFYERMTDLLNDIEHCEDEHCDDEN